MASAARETMNKVKDVTSRGDGGSDGDGFIPIIK